MAPKKFQGEKMDVGKFLTDPKLGSWADEMEDMPMPSPGGRSGGYGAERGSGGFGSGGFSGTAFLILSWSLLATPRQKADGSYLERGGYSVLREELPLPTKPPYTVHLGNMSFDATEGDIRDFFASCEVTSVRIVEDKLEMKPKGFGYAEFATLDGLKRALDYNNSQFQGRNIRVSIATPQKDRPDAREFGDWTRKGPLADVPGQRRASDRPGFGSGGARGFESASEASSDRSSRRPAYEQGDGKVRDFGNWDRKGPLTPTLPTGSAARSTDRPTSNDGLRERRDSPAWGEGRSQDGSRPPRREFVERPVAERAPTAAETDNQWRTKMRPDAPPSAPASVAKSPALSHREISTPPSPAATPKERPRLNLAKRTVSEAPIEGAPASATSESKTSPFGAAKPIDTATREKEIEEKRLMAIKEKKEADDRAREEKKATDDKVREEKRLAKEAEKSEKLDKEPSTKDRPTSQETEKENGVQASTPAKNYEILRRSADKDGITADEELDGENANGLVIDDKAIKPREITRDMSQKINGTSSPQADGPTEASADALEDDGWSTVAKPGKNRRNGNQGARAIAS